MTGLRVYAFDVGSTIRGNFGWARVTVGCSPEDRAEGGTDIDALIRAMRDDVRAGMALSLGVESPMFLPIPRDSVSLSLGRTGDGNRSAFAPAGGYVAALGLHQVAFVLQKLADLELVPVLAWRTWNLESVGSLLLWEAFVSGAAHTRDEDHERDAATAAVSFAHRLRTAKMVPAALRSDVVGPDGEPPLSLVGAAALWAGMSKDLSLLKCPVLVVRPSRRFEGDIAAIKAA